MGKLDMNQNRPYLGTIASYILNVNLRMNTMNTEASNSPETILSETEIVGLTAKIVGDYARGNATNGSDLVQMIGNVHAALKSLLTPAAEPVAEVAPLEPAVPIRNSVKTDYIVCLEDGKKLKMLKRHLMSHYGMTPDDYRAKWGLKADYPMVAPAYAAQRRELAKSIGLGRKPGSKNKPKATAAA